MSVTPATLKKYIESKKGEGPNKTIANHILEDGVITENDFKYLDQLYQRHKDTQPLKGKTILFNQHIDWATFLLMSLYQSLGATVEASNLNLTAKPFARSAFAHSKIPYFGNQIPNHEPDYYDHIVDCGAGTIGSFNPINGVAELTQTYPEKYKGKDTYVFSVNRLLVKILEDQKGIGEAGLATLPFAIDDLLVRQNGVGVGIATPQNRVAIYEKRFARNYYVIIGGAGQVAAGLAHAFIKKGVKKDHILLVDRDDTNALAHIMDDTKDIPFLKNEQGKLAQLADKAEFKQAILAHMQKTEPTANLTLGNFSERLGIITATGVENLMTTYGYEPKDFDPVETWFMNMGQPDEWGENFEQANMVGDTKSAMNFGYKWLKRDNHMHPATPTHYLMGSMAALAESSIYAILHHRKGFAPGLHAIPSAIDIELLKSAVEIYGDEFSPMLKLIHTDSGRRRIDSPQDSSLSGSDTSAHESNSPPVSPDRQALTNKKRGYEEETAVKEPLMFSPIPNDSDRRRRLRSADKPILK